ncbi:MAG: pyridoxamine 5'-phosphate oxidase family protein [Acidimicrobiales bacterium]
MANDEHVIPDDVDQFIAAHKRTFMITRRKDGSPTCHPMARFYADRSYYMNMYASSVKHANLTRDPRVCCLVTTNSDEPELRAVVLRGTARQLPGAETLARDAPEGVVLARGIGMEGVKSVEDRPEKFEHEDAEDMFKRAAVMVERIRDEVRVLWQVTPVESAWLEDVRTIGEPHAS